MNHLVNALYLAAIGLAAVFGYVLVTKGPKAVAAAANAVNPLNQDNAIKTGVDKVVQQLTGDANATLGAKIFELTHPGTVQKEKALSTPIPPAPPATSAQPGLGAGPAPDILDPSAPDNAVVGLVFGGGA